MDTLEQSTTTPASVDRFMGRFVDFEAVADGSAATGGAPAGDGPSPTTPADPAVVAGGEADPSAAETGAAPAWTPEQISALRSDAEFQAFVAEEASTIAQAQFQQMLEQHAAQAGIPQEQQQPGFQGNLNEFLDPMGENFGVNLATILGGLMQQMQQTVGQTLQPFQEQAMQAQAAEHDDILKTAITDTAATLGGLRGGDAAVQRVMADVRTRFMPEAARMYGNTDRAAQVAIERAIRAERDYQQQIAGTQAAADAEHLAAVASARTDLTGTGSGSGVVTLPNQPLSARERIAKYAPQIQAARTA